MNVRGTIVTVIDLSRRLGGPGVGADASVVLVEYGGKLVGIAVDEVTEVLRLRPDEIDPPGPEHGAPGVITGVGHSGDTIVIILDMPDEAFLRRADIVCELDHLVLKKMRTETQKKAV